MRGPIARLMVESEQLELLSQIRREFLVLRARILPVVDRTHLVEKFARLHGMRLQVDKETLVHVGIVLVIRQYHYAIVFMERHGKQCLYTKVHSIVVHSEQVEMRLKASNRTLFNRAYKLQWQLHFMPTYHV